MALSGYPQWRLASVNSILHTSGMPPAVGKKYFNCTINQAEHGSERGVCGQHYFFAVLCFTSQSSRAFEGTCRMCLTFAGSLKRMSWIVSSDTSSSARKKRTYSPMTWFGVRNGVSNAVVSCFLGTSSCTRRQDQEHLAEPKAYWRKCCSLGDLI